MQDLLKKLGLSENESKVYLALLESGPSYVSQITKQAVINRTTGYDVLEKLAIFGLVNHVSGKGSKKKYVAESPHRLFQFFSQKNKNYKKRLSELKGKLDDLDLRYATGEKPTIIFYEGDEAIKQITSDEQLAKKGILSMVDFDAWDQPDIRHLILKYINRVANEEVPEKILILDSAKARSWIKKYRFARKRLEYRMLPADKFPFFYSDFSIFNDIVWFFSLKAQSRMATRIENKYFADTLRILYHLAWEAAEKYNLKKK